ncbi:CoA ester lyase [Rhodococcus wratislaviensis]|uniref:HpcH/HpaI aldolase/citrate lyase family protein n=1 Tax=Rhodococcus wratislaviensis TaxID=44752 RepID=UPI001788ADF7|nr:CoA ester lyase [Rhodococcus wratislaviensis]
MTGRADDDLSGVRSLLFVPGDDPHKLAGALSSSADGVIADLEDAVAPKRKDSARLTVLETLSQNGDSARRLVRINGLDTPWAADDLAGLEDVAIDAIVVPKATPDTIGGLPRSGVPVIALIETSLGLRRAYEVAQHPRVVALMLGGADLGAELRLQSRNDGLELLHARSMLVVDSAAAGIRPPFDVVHLAPRNIDDLVTESRLARSLGFGGKACIHPCQIEPVNRVFSPSAAELEHAREVVDALDAALAAGLGTAIVRGQLVDEPVARHARSLLGQSH